MDYGVNEVSLPRQVSSAGWWFLPTGKRMPTLPLGYRVFSEARYESVKREETKPADASPCYGRRPEEAATMADWLRPQRALWNTRRRVGRARFWRHEEANQRAERSYH